MTSLVSSRFGAPRRLCMRDQGGVSSLSTPDLNYVVRSFSSTAMLERALSLTGLWFSSILSADGRMTLGSTAFIAGETTVSSAGYMSYGLALSRTLGSAHLLILYQMSLVVRTSAGINEQPEGSFFDSNWGTSFVIS